MNKNLSKFEKDIINHAESINNIEEQYNYIYDSICTKMDDKFKENNFCDFKDDKCIRQRNCKTKHETMGCCYTFKYSKSDGFPIDTGLCKYLNDKRCTQKCITCKMYTCSYLRKNGIKFLIEENPIITTFFNKKQINYLKTSFFTPQQEIIENLIKWKT